jgi:hypothetical protein
MKLTLIAALLISSVTYQQKIVVNQKTQLDQEFKIKIGQEVLIDNLKIKFDAVSEDNRCACDHQCSTRHKAVVIFRLESPQSVSRCIVLTAYSEPDETRSRGYKISLLRLNPCRKTYGSFIDSREYEATLLITKSETEIGPEQNSNARQQGQSKPNFSGTWRRMQAVDASSKLVISHQGTKLEVTSESFVMRMTSGTISIYHIDGEKHVTDEISYRNFASERMSYRNQRTSTRVESLVKWEGDKVVFVGKDGRREWELSESGKHLILTTGTRKIVYQKADEN